MNTKLIKALIIIMGMMLPTHAKSQTLKILGDVNLTTPSSDDTLKKMGFVLIQLPKTEAITIDRIHLRGYTKFNRAVVQHERSVDLKTKTYTITGKVLDGEDKIPAYQFEERFQNLDGTNILITAQGTYLSPNVPRFYLEFDFPIPGDCRGVYSNSMAEVVDASGQTKTYRLGKQEVSTQYQVKSVMLKRAGLTALIQSGKNCFLNVYDSRLSDQGSTFTIEVKSSKSSGTVKAGDTENIECKLKLQWTR